MATRNDVTGDSIKSRVNTKAYQDNWDAIFGKKEINKRNEDPLDVYNDARMSTILDEKAWSDTKEEK